MLLAQWNIAIEGGANYIPVTFSEYGTGRGNPVVITPMNYTLGTKINYKRNENKFSAGLTLATARFKVNNLTIISDSFSPGGGSIVEGVIYRSEFTSKAIRLELEYARQILITQKASLWSGFGVIANVPWGVGYDYKQKCGFPTNSKVESANTKNHLEYSGIATLESCITWNTTLEKPIANSSWSYTIGTSVLYYVPYTEFGFLESQIDKRRNSDRVCNFVRLETYNTFGFQVKVGLQYQLGKK
jgi:hypothetical protein